MKTFMTLMTILFLTTSSFAAEITEAEVKTFLDSWLAAQNKGKYSNYAAMYADNFTGIRRTGSSTHNMNRDGWLKDRKKMFKKKMVVEAANPEIKLAGITASVKFEQTWSSGTYKDKGDKQLDLVLENGKLKIIREEMLFSKKEDVQNINNKSEILDKQSQKIPKKLEQFLSRYGRWFDEYSAPKGWRLFEINTPEHSWFEIVNGKNVWNLSRYQLEAGQVSEITGQVQWKTNDVGVLSALIFSVNAQDENDFMKRVSRFIVIGLTDDTPRYCGIAKTNLEANKMASKLSKCKIISDKEVW